MTTTEQHAPKSHMPKVEHNPTNERMKEIINYDELLNCMRCGFCLPACPTYRETGMEASSPRGRIALMKASADGHLNHTDVLEKQLNQCLGCRACEPACPSGVQYGELLEQSRQAVEETHTQHRWWIDALRSLFFRYFFPKQSRMRLLGTFIGVYQATGLSWLAQKSGIMNIMPESMNVMHATMPQTRGSGVAKEMGTFIPAQGKKIGTVGMFSGCLMDIMFLETNKNTVTLLSEAGFDVVIPTEQNCCGALHAHSGEREQAKHMAMHNVDVFRKTDVDFIVSNAGGCGALLKEYNHLLEDEEQSVRDNAGWFAARVRDISELLIDHSPLRRVGSLPGKRISFQGSCHLRNGMKVDGQPVQLLQSIEGAEFVPLFESERCCGSAGIYNLVQPEMAGDILDEKMVHVRDTRADILVTSNPGCLLQMQAGIYREGMSSRMRAMHVVDVLMEARHNQ